MEMAEFVKEMPKVELHVHIEGSIRPETVLKLAKKNGIPLPADTVEGLRQWYSFRDFPHFVEVYVAVSRCIQTAEDVELVVREFLEGQAAQSVLHTEATYTASTMEKYAGIPWPDQLAALQRARQYGKDELGVTCDFIIDIVRGDPPERARQVAEWVKDGFGNGVCALGLAGEERLGEGMYGETFAWIADQGIPVVAHAGETMGPASIREALAIPSIARIGHGVRCVEDPFLVQELRDRRLPLEVCPTSNVCLGVYPSWEEHPLGTMVDEGLNVSVNSDDPPMFGTTVTDEWQRCVEVLEFDPDIIWSLTLNAANASLLPADAKRELIVKLREGFAELDSDED